MSHAQQPDERYLKNALQQADSTEDVALRYGVGTALGLEAHIASKTIRAQHAHIADLEAAHLRELAAYRTTVENLERKVFAYEQALRTIAEFPATDLMMNMDSANMRRIAEKSIRSSPAPAAVAVPNGWREKFAAEVYANLAAADNQDIPLEDYPARILKVLDSIVGPRHPVVIQWRNDAIQNCIAISYKYCRDPESHKYLKQDLEALLAATPPAQAQVGLSVSNAETPAPQAQDVQRDAELLERLAQWCDDQATSDWYGRKASDMVRLFAQQRTAIAASAAQKGGA